LKEISKTIKQKLTNKRIYYEFVYLASPRLLNSVH